ncbi:helix-turn-helix domain-containing protein [Enterobacter quasiroggenkampii]|uniref:helix-turn-helix domain-containing protein n=1 Tax=Enterobacter quasiroggenkampii TaxID=2497436 RepID=UPI0021CE7B41|nr:helix-turn-helix transcriptional regulator [Enterobacter quasiroggenkampii]MCU6369997.1 helix-turn-helix domain-containing protein [Enterobacter quasiroggenkampii]
MKLKDYLQRNRITQKEFAKKVNVSQAHVSRVASGTWSVKGRVALHWSQATDWNVTPHELSPSDYPHPSDGIPPEIQSIQQNKSKVSYENHTDG